MKDIYNPPLLALAVDCSDADEARSLLQALHPRPPVIKIGLELTYSIGILESVSLIRQVAADSLIFLDLKLHDIPNTVAKAVSNLNKLGVDFLTVHASGGQQMLHAARSAAGSTQLIAVTVLTSIDAAAASSIYGSTDIGSISHRLAICAADSGLGWIVASVHECPHLKKHVPTLSIVTPGIRLPSSDIGDQARIATPAEAIRSGSDMLVIGRTVTAAVDQQAAWSMILHDYSLTVATSQHNNANHM